MKILTIDLEDWFHILDNPTTAAPEKWDSFESRVEGMTVKLLDLLDAHSAKSTVFVLGWVAARFPDLIREVKNRGHEIACHSHHHQLVYKQSPLEFERDLVTATEAIESACGVRPRAYRAPGFSITTDCLWAFQTLAKHGYTIDCSVFPSPRAHGGIPGFTECGPCQLYFEDNFRLLCLPINVKNLAFFNFVYSGGGYFRLLPMSVQQMLFKSDDYVMTYFHPRDFDPDQPMAPGLNIVRKFKSYVGLSTSARKLEKLLENFQFLTIAEAAARVQKSVTMLPHVDLAALKPSENAR